MKHVEMEFTMMDKRHMGIGGSDANIIWRNIPEELNKLYNIKGTINKDIKGEDLSDVFPVQMGILTEQLNIKWFEKKYDWKVDRGGCYSNAFNSLDDGYPFFCHTDGIVLDSYGQPTTFLECKHTNPFGTVKEKIASYMPQLQFYMMHLEVNSCWLSIIRGNVEPVVYEIDANPEYQHKLNLLCIEFWKRVQNRSPYPDSYAHAIDETHHDLVKDVLINKKKDYDMKDTNWNSICDRLDQTEGAVDIFNEAKKELKALVPKDASKCTTETSKWTATSGMKSITLRKKKEGDV